MEIKTCEQYVLTRLAQLEEENAKLKDDLEAADLARQAEADNYQIQLDDKDSIIEEFKKLLGAIKFRFAGDKHYISAEFFKCITENDINYQMLIQSLGIKIEEN